MKRMNQELYEMLKNYAASDYYPWHMPGHKRRLVEFDNPFSMDITEIDGFDDLHHPEGILKEAMEEAARIYDSKKSYFLVNGSSCGILAAVSAAVKPGGKLLLARNCHKSAYHAALLQQAQVTYLYPRLESEGFYGAVQAAEVEAALKADPEIEAVMIVSPGYEGIVSDIKAIAQVAHVHGCALLVDEAHGAHFPFRNKKKQQNNAGSLENHEANRGDSDDFRETVEFPASALENGADIVIQSLHKTLPSLTQTAILHLGENSSQRIDPELLELYLRIYQSSSPSYIFMASIDHCIRLMAGKQGQKLMETYAENLYYTRKELREKLQVLCLYEPLKGKGETEKIDRSETLEVDCEIQKDQSVCLYDPSKFVILANGSMDGTKLADTLRNQYHLEPEMNTDHYVILMSSPADTREGFQRMTKALVEIDGKLQENVEQSQEDMEKLLLPAWVSLPQKAPNSTMKIHQAITTSGQWIPLEQAQDQISHDFVYIYPPGIPLLVPGEQIQQNHLDIIQTYQAHGLEVHGTQNGKIRCIKVIK